MPKRPVIRRLDFQGLDVAVEFEAGDKRPYRDDSGKEKFKTMKAAYGEVRDTKGLDGDAVDVYIGPNEDSDKVFVVTQMTKGDWDKVDEEKCILGVDSMKAARALYLAHYDDPRFCGSIKEMPMSKFQERLATKGAVGKKIASASQRIAEINYLRMQEGLPVLTKGAHHVQIDFREDGSASSRTKQASEVDPEWDADLPADVRSELEKKAPHSLEAMRRNAVAPTNVVRDEQVGIGIPKDHIREVKDSKLRKAAAMARVDIFMKEASEATKKAAGPGVDPDVAARRQVAREMQKHKENRQITGSLGSLGGMLGGFKLLDRHVKKTRNIPSPVGVIGALSGGALVGNILGVKGYDLATRRTRDDLEKNRAKKPKVELTPAQKSQRASSAAKTLGGFGLGTAAGLGVSALALKKFGPQMFAGANKANAIKEFQGKINRLARGTKNNFQAGYADKVIEKRKFEALLNLTKSTPRESFAAMPDSKQRQFVSTIGGGVGGGIGTVAGYSARNEGKGKQKKAAERKHLRDRAIVLGSGAAGAVGTHELMKRHGDKLLGYKPSRTQLGSALIVGGLGGAQLARAALRDHYKQAAKPERLPEDEFKTPKRHYRAAKGGGSLGAALGITSGTISAIRSGKGHVVKPLLRGASAGALGAGIGEMASYLKKGDPPPKKKRAAAEGRIGRISDRLDDVGIAMLATPYAAEGIGKMLAHRSGRLGAIGRAASGVGHALHDGPHKNKWELAGLGLVAPGVTHNLAKGINKAIPHKKVAFSPQSTDPGSMMKMVGGLLNPMPGVRRGLTPAAVNVPQTGATLGRIASGAGGAISGAASKAKTLGGTLLRHGGRLGAVGLGVGALGLGAGLMVGKKLLTGHREEGISTPSYQAPRVF